MSERDSGRRDWSRVRETILGRGEQYQCRARRDYLDVRPARRITRTARPRLAGQVAKPSPGVACGASRFARGRGSRLIQASRGTDRVAMAAVPAVASIVQGAQ